MFGENLKKLRKEKGLSQQEVALRLHVVRQTVSKWEQGLSVPDADLLVKLADVLGHSSIETTRIYLLTTGVEHTQMLERLGLVL